MSILNLVSNGDVQRSFRACIQSSGQVQSWLTKVPVRSKNIKFGPKWVENQRFGPKQRPNESYGLSGPLLRPKTAKNPTFQGKQPPAAPGGPRRPPSLLSAQAGAYVTASIQPRRSVSHVVRPGQGSGPKLVENRPKLAKNCQNQPKSTC